MPISALRPLAALTAAALLATALPALAQPGPASACLFIHHAGLHTLPDGSLSDDASPAAQQRYGQLLREARQRISDTFGAPQASPLVVFFSQPQGFGRYRLNAVGSAQFIGSRACVLMGPQGHNVDALAHELVHAEIHHRAGALKRWLQLPTWFDEGVAMQVDYRPRYSLPADDAANASEVRQLNSFGAFFAGDEQTVVRNYARARYEAAGWLARTGRHTLYQRLARMQAGESFAEISAP